MLAQVVSIADAVAIVGASHWQSASLKESKSKLLKNKY
jgi:hypothetical protein